MKNALSYFLCTALVITILSCTTKFPNKTIETQNLSGYISGGNAFGVYNEAGLRIDIDSISMTDWPMSRLTDHLNTILDSNLTDQTKASDFYTIKIKNTGKLEQIEFCDSIVSVLVSNGLIK